MQPFTVVTGIAAPLLRANIDTGTIIPSRFMRSRSINMGEKMFSDWRYNLDGSENPEFVLNRAPYREATIMLSGTNFGCGSSREAAVYALLRFGITCVIAPSFGEIFTENALQNGLLPLILPEEVVASLVNADDPTLTVDLHACVVRTPDGREIGFSIAPDRRMALLEGLDETALIQRYTADIDAFRAADQNRRPWLYQR